MRQPGLRDRVVPLRVRRHHGASEREVVLQGVLRGERGVMTEEREVVEEKTREKRDRERPLPLYFVKLALPHFPASFRERKSTQVLLCIHFFTRREKGARERKKEKRPPPTTKTTEAAAPLPEPRPRGSRRGRGTSARAPSSTPLLLLLLPAPR